VLDTLPLKLII